MPRRIALGSLVAGVLALVATAVHAFQLHAAHWWGYRDDLVRSTAMQRRAAELDIEWHPAGQFPHPVPMTSFLQAVPTGLLVLSVALLSIALVWAGYRWWGVVVPMALNALGAMHAGPIVDLLVIPGGTRQPAAGWSGITSNPWDAWTTPAASYPWADRLLLGLLMTIPALVAVGRLRADSEAARARTTSGTPTRAALTWSGAVAGLYAIWVAFSSGAVASLYTTLLLQSFASSEYRLEVHALERAGTAAVVIVSTGLLTASLARAWAIRAGICAVTLVLLNAVVMCFGSGRWEDWLDPAAIAWQLGMLAIGPAAVLLGPSLGRWWVATFRRTESSAPATPESLAP